jgi:DNA-directed RNA polymerase subunit RPC12/RpoP
VTLSDEQRKERGLLPDEFATGKGNNRRYSYLVKFYGMTLKEFNDRLKAQQGKCAICGREVSLEMKHNMANKAVVDHDHKTKKNRGILCRNCNIGIGFLGDDVEILIGAVVYLKSFEEETK